MNRFIHGNGLDAMETPPVSEQKPLSTAQKKCQMADTHRFMHQNGLDATETSLPIPSQSETYGFPPNDANSQPFFY